MRLLGYAIRWPASSSKPYAKPHDLCGVVYAAASSVAGAVATALVAEWHGSTQRSGSEAAIPFGRYQVIGLRWRTRPPWNARMDQPQAGRPQRTSRTTVGWMDGRHSRAVKTRQPWTCKSYRSRPPGCSSDVARLAGSGGRDTCCWCARLVVGSTSGRRYELDVGFELAEILRDLGSRAATKSAAPPPTRCRQSPKARPVDPPAPQCPENKPVTRAQVRTADRVDGDLSKHADSATAVCGGLDPVSIRYPDN